MLTPEQEARALHVRNASIGAEAAINLIKRLGWPYDSSSFASSAPAPMLEEASRITRASFDNDTQFEGFRHWLGF